VIANEVGIYIEAGHDNTIGGRRPQVRNIIAGNGQGVSFGSAAGPRNRVEGNCFGIGPSGACVLPNGAGVTFLEATERQIIGGDVPEAGNFFGGSGEGVYVRNSTPASFIRNNTFGRSPTGAELGIYTGVMCINSSPRLAGNLFAGATRGVVSRGPSARSALVRNEFRSCSTAVLIRNDAQPNLGNLGSASTADDGGNLFRRGNGRHIVNRTAQRIRAESNNFFTTSKSQIDAKIIDRRDNASYGRVDFSPLLGGVIPSGIEGIALNVAAVCAPTAAGGAEIALTLSADASVSVEILNIAGRPVRSLLRDRLASQGVNRLAWDGRAGSGLTVPAGVYVVRATARAEGGAQAVSMSTVSLRR
jgi:hypothetical protein